MSTSSSSDFGRALETLAEVGKLFESLATKLPELGSALFGSGSGSPDGAFGEGGLQPIAAKADAKGKKDKTAQKGAFDDLFEAIKTGVSATVGQVKIDFTDLGTSLKNIFKAVGQGIADTLQSYLGNIITKGAQSLFGGLLNAIMPSASGATAAKSSGYQPTVSSLLAGVTKAATGGVIEPGKVALVGEEGPELIVPNSMATVLTATQTGNLMTRGAVGGKTGGFAPAAASETKVIINNHTGAEARASRRRGPDGNDIIEVVIGRVAQDMARGGMVSDAAALRFGLTAQGT